MDLKNNKLEFYGTSFVEKLIPLHLKYNKCLEKKMKRSKKKLRKLYGRQYSYDQMLQGKGSDIVRKHPNGFKRPGSANK